MSEDLNSYRLENTEKLLTQLIWQFQKLTESINNVYDRLGILEKDFFDRTLKKKIISIFLSLYPVILMLFIVFNNIDRKKMIEFYKDSQGIIGKMLTLEE